MTVRHKRILVIEEDPTLLQITAFRLELLGHSVHSCGGADEALEWLNKEKPDLIAVGNAADADPLELLSRLSDDPRTSQAPMLYLSANSDLNEVQRAFNAGADEYLLVPYDPLVLEEKVGGLLLSANARV